MQEQAVGPLTLFSGLNSALSSGFEWRSNGVHREAWWEADASARALNYFTGNEDFDNFRVPVRGGTPISAADNFGLTYIVRSLGSFWQWGRYIYTTPLGGLLWNIHDSQ